jgi:hypothetical protein
VIERLVADWRVRGAARVGFAFGVDPVAHLGSPVAHQLIREAAAVVITQDLERASKDVGDG